MLKVVKIQNHPYQTADVEHFKAALNETETITLLELPSLAPSKNISSESENVKVCTKYETGNCDIVKYISIRNKVTNKY